VICTVFEINAFHRNKLGLDLVFLKTKQNRKKKMKQIILAAMFMVLLMIRSSCADEITLHDGQVILGTITELKGDEIGVSTAKGMVVVHTRNLKAIILQNRYLNESFQDVVVNLAELNDWIQGKESISLVASLEKDKKQFINKINTLFTNEKFDDLENIVSEIRQKRSTYFEGSFLIDDFYNGINVLGPSKDLLGEIIKTRILLQKWIALKPDTMTAKIALADNYSAEAWEYRGGGYANTVSQEGQLHFIELSQKAWETAEDLYLKNNDLDEFSYAALISLGLSSNQSKDKLYTFLLKSIERNSLYYPAIQEITRIQLPKWGGSEQLVEKFANDLYERNIDGWGAYHYFLVANYVWNNYGEKILINYSFDWNIAKGGVWKFCETFPGNLTHIHHLAAMACLYDDRESARKAFDIIGNNWEEGSKVWGSNSVLEKCRQWAETDRSSYISPIFKAIIAGDYLKLKELHDTGEDFDIKNDNKETPLLFSISQEQPLIAMELIDMGVNINATDAKGCTPLYNAAGMSYSNVVDALLGKGADYKIKCSTEWTALHTAASRGFVNIVNKFLEIPGIDIYDSVKGLTAAHLAAQNGHVNVLKALYEFDKKSLDVKDKFGRTPVQMAAKAGYIDAVRYLIDVGVDVNVLTWEKKRPLNYAQSSNNAELVQLLVVHGAYAENFGAQTKAIEDLTKANDLGLVLMKSLRFDEALKEFDRAISYAPDQDDAPYINKYLIIFNERKDYHQALKLIQKAIEINPRRYQNYFRRGETYIKLGDMMRAYKDFVKVLSESPDIEESAKIRAQYGIMMKIYEFRNWLIMLGISIVIIFIWRRFFNK
jgi:ankyrin repeat protein